LNDAIYYAPDKGEPIVIRGKREIVPERMAFASNATLLFDPQNPYHMRLFLAEGQRELLKAKAEEYNIDLVHSAASKHHGKQKSIDQLKRELEKAKGLDYDYEITSRLNDIESMFKEGDLSHSDVWKYLAWMQKAGFEGYQQKYLKPLTLKEAIKISEDAYVEVWIDGEFYINSLRIDAKDTVKFDKTVKELHDQGRLKFYKKREYMDERDPEIYIFDPGKNLKLVEDPVGGRISGEFSAERDIRYMPAQKGIGRAFRPEPLSTRTDASSVYFKTSQDREIQRKAGEGEGEDETKRGFRMRSTYFPRQAQQERRELQPR
jgi:hypothetical protein